MLENNIKLAFWRIEMEQLIKEVQNLRARLGMKPLSNPKKLGQIKLEAMAEELLQKLEEKNQNVTTVEATAKKPKGKTIKEVSCELLSKVVGTTEEGRTLGMPYSDILAQILTDNPEAKTSLNCLRWYAGKIRIAADGYQMYTLPQIRLRPTAAAEETAE